MATIKEMAELAFPTIGDDDKEAIEALKYIGLECDNAHEYNSVRLNQQDLYIMGANAVLAEVEKALDLGEPPYLINVEQAYYRAERLIKELKDK